MKTSTLAFVALLLFTGSALAQDRVHKNDLDGIWRLQIEVEEDGDTAFERIVLKSVSGFLDEIKVGFHFRNDNVLRITTSAFGEKDVEYSEWHINDRGQLILGDTGQVDIDDVVWMLDDGKLGAFNPEDDLSSAGVYLERVD